ncbi:hypothetical protein [Burkholderia cepacia]|uniref:hypothetical protein n=1 Tax=Burkholderia cepacia TaxID=292 RepID=UPI0012D94B63|nr:hypothetical protein [Burkholderia cepacia]
MIAFDTLVAAVTAMLRVPRSAVGARRCPASPFRRGRDCIGPGRPRFRIRDSMSMAPAPRIARGTAMCTLID